MFDDEFWYVAREDDPAANSEQLALKQVNTSDIVLLEEGHCLRDHAIAACGPRANAGTSGIEATSLLTLVQMVEGGLGVTLLPEMTIKSGILKGTKLVARPFAPRAPTRTIALVARATTPLKRDFELLAEFIAEQARRREKAGVPALRRRQAQR